MKNIIVTGGCGFIGSHTCLNLLEKGFNVYIIDSFAIKIPAFQKYVSSQINFEAIFFEGFSMKLVT